MPKTMYSTATTIDGFIADPSHSLDWLFAVEGDGEGPPDFAGFMAGIGAMAMGRSTYEWVAAHLRTSGERWQDLHGDTPCWVFTHRELPGIPGATVHFVQGDVAPVHARMAQAAGDRDVWLVGGGELVGQFADRGLLDEIRLNVAPVMLGAGAPLLPRRLGSDRLELAEVTRRGPFVDLVYRVRGGPPAA